MWIAHKTRQGDTLKTIAKQYKNKDPNAILKYAKNRKFAKDLQSGKPIKPGSTIWVLDPKGKCYVLKKNGKEVILTEKEYKKFQKDVDKKMWEVLERQRRNYNYAADAHTAQLEVNKQQRFVSTIVMAFSSVPEPIWKDARKSYDRLVKVVRGRKYNEFIDASYECEFEITKYTNDVHNWVGNLISTAQGSVKKLEGVRDVGKFCGVLAAVTVAAPASFGAAVLTGSAANTGIGLLYDGAEQTSMAAHGLKPMSAREIGTRMVANAVTGAAGAAVTGKLIKYVSGPLVKLATRNAFIKQQSFRLARKVIPRSVLNRELDAFLKNKTTVKLIEEATKKGTVDIKTLRGILNRDAIVIEALHKFLMRGGMGMLTKQLGTGKWLHAHLAEWISGAPMDLANNETKIAEAAAKQLAKSGALDEVFDQVIKKNMKEFEKTLAETMEKHAEVAIMKAVK